MTRTQPGFLGAQSRLQTRLYCLWLWWINPQEYQGVLLSLDRMEKSKNTLNRCQKVDTWYMFWFSFPLGQAGHGMIHDHVMFCYQITLVFPSYPYPSRAPSLSLGFSLFPWSIVLPGITKKSSCTLWDWAREPFLLPLL